MNRTALEALLVVAALGLAACQGQAEDGVAGDREELTVRPEGSEQTTTTPAHEATSAVSPAAAENPADPSGSRHVVGDDGEPAAPAAPSGVGAGPEIPPRASARIQGAAEATPPVVRLVVRPVEVDQAEDGRGARVEATQPVALDLVADGWPGRAGDPVLTVGGLHFHRYSHPSPEVLRFVAANAADLPRGAPAVLQYGDDPSTRVVVAPSVEVP